MMKYRFLKHTADAKYRAWGKTLEEAFSNAAVAMFSIMVEPGKIKPAFDEEISVEGSDLVSLLYNFLEELLFTLDTKGFLLGKIKKCEIVLDSGVYRLSAIASGDMNLKQYELLGEVKAVTYNEMKVIEEKDNWLVQVVVDL